jgi:hypothetical protein
VARLAQADHLEAVFRKLVVKAAGAASCDAHGRSIAMKAGLPGSDFVVTNTPVTPKFRIPSHH